MPPDGVNPSETGRIRGAVEPIGLLRRRWHILQALRICLERAGYEVRPPSDWHDLLHLLGHEAPPDLILLDIVMPGLNGFELLATLKCRPSHRQIPIVVMSAMGAESLSRAIEYGAADYLNKPLDLDHLLATLERIISAPSTRTPLNRLGLDT